MLLLVETRHEVACLSGGGSGGMSTSGTVEITACTTGESTLLEPDVGNTTKEVVFGSQQGSRMGLVDEELDLIATVGVVDGETDASGSRRSHSWFGAGPSR